MIKKTTLLVLVCAIALGGAVYYFDWKSGKDEKPAADAPKPAYAIQASDVISVTLTHPVQPGEPAIQFAKHDGSWQIVQPIETGADQPTIDGIVDQIAGADILQTEPGTPDRLKVYGLDPPETSLEFQLRNGAKHALLIGSKTFNGDSVYAIVDGAKNVSLLPQLLSTSTARTLDDLRDHSVLHIDNSQIASFDLKNPSGEIVASKDHDHWKISKPGETLASQDAIDSLLQAVATAKMTSIVSEKPENLSRYGLVSPAVSFVAVDSKGAKSTLTVGKKDGDAYFARDLSRPMVFRVNGDVYKKLVERFGDLRNKKVLVADTEDLRQIQIRNANGSISLSRKVDSPEEWVFQAPDEQKGKTAASWKILDPLSGLTAEDVIDHPAANLLAQVASPAVSAILTDKSGKTTTIQVSKASGDFVYALASDSASIYKLKKEVLENLNVKAADLAP